MKRPPLFDRYVVAVVLVQLVGYAALSALVPHGDFAAVVEPLQRVPTVLLVPVAVFAVPAVIVAVLFAALLSAVGVQPTTALTLFSVYVLSVASLWAYRRVRRRGPSTTA